MSTFTVRGSRNGSLVHVTWTDGQLSGDFPTVDMVHAAADLVPIVRTDSYAARAMPVLRSGMEHPLQDPATAYRLIASLLDTVRESTGDVPALSDP